MAPGALALVSVTFDDVIMYFMEQVWRTLEEWQKELYKDKMNINYKTLVSLGCAIPKPDLNIQIEQGKEPFFRDQGHLEITDLAICSSADEHLDLKSPLGQLFSRNSRSLAREKFSTFSQREPFNYSVKSGQQNW
uniref:KRAB domain-containing protein n=1 Tax=Vombatus ursinus TaxID=29139 RepID=A0A4X2KN62_VOMUR